MTTGSAIPLRWARIESRHLLALIDQFLELLRDTEIDGDPALDRLTPAVYPADADASAEFAAATSANLLDRRAADAQIVRVRLAPVADGAGDEQVDMLVPDAELEPWLRTLTALRLVLAARLGISAADAHDPEDPRFGVYDWLGYRLETLIQAADALDEESPGSVPPTAP